MAEVVRPGEALSAAEQEYWQGVVQVWLRDPAVWYRPHAKQADFHAAGAWAVERLFLAGNRVGKTLAGAVEVAFHLTGRYPPWWQGHRFDHPVQAWAASVTRESTRDILQAVYLGGLGGNHGQSGVLRPDWVLATRLKNSMAGAVDTVQVRHVSGGVSALAFKSFDQGRVRFQGTARGVIHLDEEPPLDVWEECVLRTVTTGGRLLLTMTPLQGMTNLVQKFVADEATNQARGLAVVRAGWADAPHLPRGELRRLRATLAPHELAAREHGEPVLGVGRVFPLDEREVAVPRFVIPPDWRRCFGVDFGWTNPTAAVWLAEDPVSKIAYVTEVYAASGKTPAEHAAVWRQKGDWIPGVCDPAGQAVSQRDGQSLVGLYGAAGLWLQPADNSVEAGLMQLLTRMQEGRLKVFDDLGAWWGEFRGYHRDARGHVVKRGDHLLDATRYAVVSGLALARAGPTKAWERAPARPNDWRIA
jgi:phage terminase large subunit-like protein